MGLKDEQGGCAGVADVEVVEAATRAGDVVVVGTDRLFDDELSGSCKWVLRWTSHRSTWQRSLRHSPMR
jgi:hypothetical protein